VSYIASELLLVSAREATQYHWYYCISTKSSFATEGPKQVEFHVAHSHMPNTILSKVDEADKLIADLVQRVLRRASPSARMSMFCVFAVKVRGVVESDFEAEKLGDVEAGGNFVCQGVAGSADTFSPYLTHRMAELHCIVIRHFQMFCGRCGIGRTEVEENLPDSSRAKTEWGWFFLATMGFHPC
jgi:hypothetical protein